MITVVTLPHDPVWTALDWAKENCPSYITNSGRKEERTSIDGLVYVVYMIDYHFGDDGDAAWFTLKWK